jgi:TonB family protein
MISVMNATAVRNDWVGLVIDGRFPLLQWLGGSEQSAVYRTELPKNNAEKAAVKLCPAGAGDTEARIAAWTAAATLSHPHLARLSYTGHCELDDAALLYAVTEFADEILAEILPERALTPAEVKQMLGPVLDALSYIHAKGFVHGRLKPSNILVVNDQLKLSTDSLQAAGEPANRAEVLSIYDAPERAGGKISRASDIWSLGVIVVEALTQHPPEWDRSADSGPVVPEFIPEPFAGIARGCLQLDPARRFTLEEVRARLDPTRSLVSPAGKKDFAKVRLAAIAAAAIVLIAAISFIHVRSHHPEPKSPAEEQQQASAPSATQPQPQQQAPDTAAPAPAPDQAPAAAASNQAHAHASPSTKSSAVKGAVAERVLPDVLPSASKSIRGTVNVWVRVAVGPGGEVSSVDFESPGPSKYFARVALQAAQRWKFKPALVNGQPVASEWILQFQFTQAAIDVIPAETSP